MNYRIRAYPSRFVGESGRVAPVNTSSTDDLKTAEHTAQQFAEHYGAAVVENIGTGNRLWY
jgi:hypothetical protein